MSAQQFSQELAHNPLATPAQIACERATLRIERHPVILSIRDALRHVLLNDPAAQTDDGRASLDRVLDQWVRCHILTQMTIDQPPAMVWMADNTPRTWFGHTFPGDIIAGDNPDNSNRMTFLDGESVYELTGKFGAPKSAQFNLNIEIAHPAGGMGTHLATLTDRKLSVAPDGSFKVLIGGPPPADGGNHMRTAPGLLNFTARDSRSDWGQMATTLSLRLVSGPGLTPAADENAQLHRVAGSLFAFVDYWRQFKDGFFGFPEPNTLVLPKRRESEGGWGYIGGGRFRLDDDHALVLTTDDAGAAYTGFQVTDPWTLRPESTLRTSSLSNGQSRPDPDGRCTYVIARQDPGIANWIDTAGLSEGWFQLRWQNVPDGAHPGADEPKLVALAEIDRHVPATTPRADYAYRRRQIRERIEKLRLRTQANGADL